MNVLDQNIFDAIGVIVHNSEDEVAADLVGLGQLGVAPNNKLLFRGQTSRQPVRRWPPVDEPTVKKHQLEMEHLVSADYRQMESRLEKGESKASLDPLFGSRIAGIRSALTTYLMQCHSCWGDSAVQTWIGTLQGNLRSDKLLSIGQHYGLRTHLMDCSSDWEVALWFATHQWVNGDYVQGGDAVIYQIDVQALCQAEIEANHALNLTVPSQTCRHVDIRDTPPLLAPRAFSQRGFSIAGLESPHFLQSLIRRNGLAVHIFPRGITPSKLNCLTKAQLVPPLDQMSALFAEAGQQGVLFQQAISWINANYPSLSATLNDGHRIF